MPITINGTGFISGSAGIGTGGSSTNVAFYTNDQTVSANYTIASTQNAMSVGPISIANGISVVISTGAAWVIV